ncbi:MAG: DUF3445 domain-containing protein [Rhodobacteraceae bacterium]|nr:DUF3445 domain-containing protein [Paracoccaceae bacterium]
MKLQSSPLYHHTPYDGSRQPFTVGLEPISEDSWLEVDTNLEYQLERKAQLLASDIDAVFRAEVDTVAAQQEAYELVVEHLRRLGNEDYDVSSSPPVPRVIGVKHDEREAPLVRAARLVQEDLVLMRPSKDGYRLVAACLCFPSSWSLAEKFGKSMFAIHETVPNFNHGKMGRIVDRLFQNLKVGQLVGRYNWSIYDDAELFHPHPKRISLRPSELSIEALARLFIRVERQTLRRLPESGYVLFTIKIHHDPLATLRQHSRAAELASGLKQQLLALTPDQRTYKGLDEFQHLIVAALEDVVNCSKSA